MLQKHPLHPHLHSSQWRNVHTDTPHFAKLLSPSCSIYTHPNTNTHTPPRNKLLEPRSCQGGKMALQPRSQSDSLARAGDHRPADPASPTSFFICSPGNFLDARRTSPTELRGSAGRCWTRRSGVRSRFITRCCVWTVSMFVLEETQKTTWRLLFFYDWQ